MSALVLLDWLNLLVAGELLQIRTSHTKQKPLRAEVDPSTSVSADEVFPARFIAKLLFCPFGLIYMTRPKSVIGNRKKIFMFDLHPLEFTLEMGIVRTSPRDG